jgi:hypothetical protein
MDSNEFPEISPETLLALYGGTIVDGVWYSPAIEEIKES